MVPKPPGDPNDEPARPEIEKETVDLGDGVLTPTPEPSTFLLTILALLGLLGTAWRQRLAR